MAKSNLPEELKTLWFPPADQPVFVKVPKLNFLMIDGTGDPNSGDFQQAINVLYGICYTMKFMHQPGDPIRDSRVMPLEALWWTRGGKFDLNESRANWHWTALIMQPQSVTRQAITAAIEELRRKKNPSGLDLVRFEGFAEGLAVQIMHLGPYSEEQPNIERLHRFAQDQGYRVCGKHHEIYHNDPRRTKPERLKTVLRQPIERLQG